MFSFKKIAGKTGTGHFKECREVGFVPRTTSGGGFPRQGGERKRRAAGEEDPRLMEKKDSEPKKKLYSFSILGLVLEVFLFPFFVADDAPNIYFFAYGCVGRVFMRHFFV